MKLVAVSFDWRVQTCSNSSFFDWWDFHSFSQALEKLTKTDSLWLTWNDIFRIKSVATKNKQKFKIGEMQKCIAAISELFLSHFHPLGIYDALILELWFVITCICSNFILFFSYISEKLFLILNICQPLYSVAQWLDCWLHNLKVLVWYWFSPIQHEINIFWDSYLCIESVEAVGMCDVTA